jgi:hypothetical protein
MDENELFVIAAAIGGAILGCVLAAVLMIFFF